MKNYFFLLLVVCCFSCHKKENIHHEIKANFTSGVHFLMTDVDQVIAAVTQNKNIAQIQEIFLKARKSYKKIEWMSEYYFPSVSKSINGPAIPEFEQNDGITLPPEGFQVVEEFIFPKYDPASKQELLKELRILRSNLNRLNKVSENNSIADMYIFDALRLEVFRVISLGITGFDSPIAQQSVPEALVALESIENVLLLYKNIIGSAPYNSATSILKNGKNYLSKTVTFNDFDRAYFIKQFANPLSKELYSLQKESGIAFANEKRGLKTTAQTLFDATAFDIEAFNGFPDYETTNDKVVLGKKLFNDPILSGNNTISCSSCHHSDLAFTDGLEQTVAINGTSQIKRNTPTLNNIAFQRAFFYDTKVSYLEDQAIAVITNEVEMHGSLQKSVVALQKDKKYVKAFKKAFPKNEINEFGIKNALASYVRSLSNYDSKFDDYMQNESSFTKDEKAGFNVFTGKGKCATCHFIPLTNGTVPPSFMKSESEVLGVPNKQKKLDLDLGKYVITKAAIHKNAFKTPTIRNIALTAPYMHNGVFKTLEEVIDFYNEGGGKGLGLEVLNQTLPEDKLNLTDLEKKQLVVFMKSLTDKKMYSK